MTAVTPSAEVRGANGGIALDRARCATTRDGEGSQARSEPRPEAGFFRASRLPPRKPLAAQHLGHPERRDHRVDLMGLAQIPLAETALKTVSPPTRTGPGQKTTRAPVQRNTNQRTLSRTTGYSTQLTNPRTPQQTTGSQTSQKVRAETMTDCSTQSNRLTTPSAAGTPIKSSSAI